MPDGYRVPTIPAVHARAMAVLNEPDLEMKELASIVEMDPSLTAAVLRAANSAASAPTRRIGTAEEGVVRIGLNATRRIMLTAVIGESFRGFDRAGLDPNELWRHVLSCALLADAMTSQGGARSTAFTAGLLHDVGRMAMAQADPIRYSRIAQMARSGIEACEAESQIFGRNHAEWGVEVAEVWTLPEDVAVAIGDHHDGHATYLSRAIADSRRLSRELRIGDGVLPPLPPVEEGGDEPQLSDADRALLEQLGGVPKVLKQNRVVRGVDDGHAARGVTRPNQASPRIPGRLLPREGRPTCAGRPSWHAPRASRGGGPRGYGFTRIRICPGGMAPPGNSARNAWFTNAGAPTV